MSLIEVKRNEKYRIVIFLGTNGNKKITQSETFYGQKKDAKLREAELKMQLRDNTYIRKTNMTIYDLSLEYLKVQKAKLSPKTYITYEHRMEFITSRIGHVKLSGLTVKILEDFYTNLRTKYRTAKGTTLSPTTIQSYYAIINNMLERAVKWDYIASNPNLKIEKPKRARTNIQCYSPDEVDELLRVLQFEPIKYQAIIMLALDLGCRRGELLGLTWNDIDFKTGRVVIDKSIQSAYGKIFEKETKTENGDRINYISSSTIEVLQKYKKEQLSQKMLLGSKWINTNRVFTTEFGDTMHPDTPTKILYKILDKYHLKRITFHGLRHTNVSLMISKGVQAQVISRKVGHSSVQVTDKIYSHFFEEEFKDVANVMEDIFSKSKIQAKIKPVYNSSSHLKLYTGN